MPTAVSKANPILSQSILAVGFLFGVVSSCPSILKRLTHLCGWEKDWMEILLGIYSSYGENMAAGTPGLPCPESVKGSVLKMKSVENGV